jgi:hypothetical protein
LKKLANSFHWFLKWRRFSKWLQNWFFDHNSVSFELFCFLVFVLGLYLDRKYFLEDFFIRFKMASDFQDGGRKSKEHKFENWQHFCIQSFAMSLYCDQQNDPNSYFVKLAKNRGSIQNGGSKSDFKA